MRAHTHTRYTSRLSNIRNPRSDILAYQCNRVWLGLRNETVGLIKLILVIIKSTWAGLITRVGARNYAFAARHTGGFAEFPFSACWRPPARINISSYRALRSQDASFPHQLTQWDLKLKCAQIGSGCDPYDNFNERWITCAYLLQYRKRYHGRASHTIDSIKLASSTRIIRFGFDLIPSWYYDLLAVCVKRCNWNSCTHHISVVSNFITY